VHDSVSHLSRAARNLVLASGTFLLFGLLSHGNEVLLYVTKDGLHCRAYHYQALLPTYTVSNMAD